MLHLLQTKKGPGIQQLDEPRDCLREASTPQGKRPLLQIPLPKSNTPTNKTLAIFPCSSWKQLDFRQRQTAGYVNQRMMCSPFIIMIGQTETSWVASKVACTCLHGSNSPAPHSGQWKRWHSAPQEDVIANVVERHIQDSKKRLRLHTLKLSP